MRMTIRFYDGPSDDVESEPVGVEITGTVGDVESAREVAFKTAALPAIRTQVRSLTISSEDGTAVERWHRTKDGWVPERG